MPRALPEPRLWLANTRLVVQLIQCANFTYEITAHEDEPPFVLRVATAGGEGFPPREATGRVLSTDMPPTEVVRLAYEATLEVMVRNLDGNFTYNNGRPFVQTIDVRNRAGWDNPDYHDLRTDQHWWPERQVQMQVENEERIRRRAERAENLRRSLDEAEQTTAASPTWIPSTTDWIGTTTSAYDTNYYPDDPEPD